MSRGTRAWLGVVCGLALGIGGVVAIDASTSTAGAQAGGVELTAEQLLVNQRISQAAVRRSNRALNYLAPIRTAGSDAADDGRRGVTALDRVPGSGEGWTSAQIADDAVTGPKIAGDAVTTDKIATGGVGATDLADGAVGTGKIAANAVGTGQIAPGGVASGDLADDAVTAAKLADRSVGPDALAAPTAASLFSSGAVASSGIAVAIPFTAPSDPSFDTGGFFDPAAPTDLRIPRAGIYRLDVAVGFESNAAGYRQVNLTRVSGLTISLRTLAAGQAASGAETALAAGVLIKAEAGDRLTISALQGGTGGNLNVGGSVGISYLGPPGIV